MNELERTMTVKEVADALGVSRQIISEKVKELFPQIVTNGVTTHLNHIQVTKIKTTLQVNPYLPQLEKVEDDLEMLLLQKKLDLWKDRKIETLQNNLKIITEENQVLKPKAISFDVLMKTEDDMSITDAAKHFNMGQKKVFEALRQKGYLTLSSLPTQKAINANVLHLKETVCKDNKTRAQAVVKVNQLDNFYKAVK